MAVFDNRSITSKALTLGVAPAVCVLVLVSAAFFLTSYLLARRSLARDMDALAVVVRDNVSAALAFNDRSTATDVLSALRAKQNVDGVCVFNSDGLLFASYSTGGFHCAPTVIEAESLETPRNVRAEPVMVGQRRVGVVQLVGNYDDLIEWMTIQAAITALALVAGSLLAFVLARRMERAISRPVIELAAVAREVTATGDYTVRAKRTTDDEVGALATSLNTMLEQIQHHNRMKDEFLAALSHELRTPLNAILGWLQIIRSTKLEPEPLERALSSVDRNARAQARLVEDLLDVSRIVTGKL